MTFVSKCDLAIMKVNMHAKKEVAASRHSSYLLTHTPAHTHTSETITSLAIVVGKY